MAVSVKSIDLWRREIEDHPGALADALAPLADQRVDVQVLMAYRFPGQPGRAAIELFPVTGKRSVAAATSAGFTSSSIPALLVEGDNAPGLGARLSRAIADAGINLDFVVAQVIGRKYSAVFGFADEAGAAGAAPLIKKAGAGGAAGARKTASPKRSKR